MSLLRTIGAGSTSADSLRYVVTGVGLLSGASAVTVSDDKWTKNLPCKHALRSCLVLCLIVLSICHPVSSGIVCPEIVGPGNGQLLTSMEIFRFGDVASFVCDIGYVMNGMENISCSASGSWSDAVPTCDGKHTYIFVLLLCCRSRNEACHFSRRCTRSHVQQLFSSISL